MAKRRRQIRGVAPTVNCLLLCDDVLISQGKHKHFLQGIIGQIVVLELPAIIGGYVAYVRFPDVHGDQKVKLAFESAWQAMIRYSRSRRIFRRNPTPWAYTLS